MVRGSETVSRRTVWGGDRRKRLQSQRPLLVSFSQKRVWFPQGPQGPASGSGTAEVLVPLGVSCRPLSFPAWQPRFRAQGGAGAAQLGVEGDLTLTRLSREPPALSWAWLRLCKMRLLRDESRQGPAGPGLGKAASRPGEQDGLEFHGDDHLGTRGQRGSGRTQTPV